MVINDDGYRDEMVINGQNNGYSYNGCYMITGCNSGY